MKKIIIVVAGMLALSTLALAQDDDFKGWMKTIGGSTGGVKKNLEAQNYDAAVTDARRQAKALGCDELMAFATSAVRDATNSADVLDRVAVESGVDLQVLSGEDEARLTFLAVRRWLGWSSGNLLCLDIGGGSLELAAGGVPFAAIEFADHRP